MTHISRDQFLSADGPATGDVEVPKLGGVVSVRGMSSGERDKWEFRQQAAHRAATRGEDMPMRAFLVARCTLDADGSRMFSDGDIPALASKDAAIVEPIVDKVLELSGITPGVDRQEQHEELVEGFDETGEPD